MPSRSYNIWPSYREEKKWCISSQKVDLDSPTPVASVGPEPPPKKKSKLGIAVYLDELFKEKEKVLSQVQKMQAKYQYVLEEKNWKHEFIF